MSTDFRIMKQIGAGCGGTVKLARRNADQKLYALKELELPRDPQEAAAVLQETHILASLDQHLSSARGTAGRAIHDREIQNQVGLFRARADSARAELARRPFRWLRVRLF